MKAEMVHSKMSNKLRKRVPILVAYFTKSHSPSFVPMNIYSLPLIK